MTFTQAEVEAALGRIVDKAITWDTKRRPVAKWFALDLVAHIEADLFGRDPGHAPGCPLCG